jgi:hypothetical protein
VLRQRVKPDGKKGLIGNPTVRIASTVAKCRGCCYAAGISYCSRPRPPEFWRSVRPAPNRQGVPRCNPDASGVHECRADRRERQFRLNDQGRRRGSRYIVVLIGAFQLGTRSSLAWRASQSVTTTHASKFRHVAHRDSDGLIQDWHVPIERSPPHRDARNLNRFHRILVTRLFARRRLGERQRIYQKRLLLSCGKLRAGDRRRGLASVDSRNAHRACAGHHSASRGHRHLPQSSSHMSCEACR